MYVDFDSLGKRIAQRRVALGYKQNELAEKADLSNNYLSNIENGHSILRNNSRYVSFGYNKNKWYTTKYNW